ncbi:Dipeptide transport system permease protein dppC [Gluconacetobacter sp. SXCC-1]|uniref:ABC transporter permease n=1 Tax=Komagataeibacter TaxID=1434011 RepID=UPI000207FC5B|nr:MULTISPECIES: ABC transporter permease [Komagataeibacter]EGG79303.1 Dipeptide transport system permease protein dppC [Gluconacetobacter sp. SXCC-1]
MMKTFFSALIRSRSGLLGFGLVFLFIMVSVLAPWSTLPDPTMVVLPARLMPPDWIGAHPLGTDAVGRDILSRIAYGGRTTLMVAMAAVMLGSVMGTTAGIMSGFMGGLVDQALMRIVDMQLAFPLMMLALLVVAVLGPSTGNVIVVLALTSWTRYARIIRAQVLSLREREFVLSARAVGASSWWIMSRHILPNVLTPALVVATLELARIIIMIAALSFLGLGVQPPAPDWGQILAEGRVYISTAWWVVTFPGLAIVLSVLGINLFGDWLRDYLDPKTWSNR